MEKIWHWPLQASPHDMTKMIQTFHQISGQLGCKSKGMFLFTLVLNGTNSILSISNQLSVFRGE